MKTEIGSNFWLSQEEIEEKVKKDITPSIFGCNGSDFVWLSTGRSAISFVIKSIEERNPNITKRVCLPAFTCHTVFEPFLNAGYEVFTLPVNIHLKTNPEDIIKCVEDYKPGVILFHKYFGFDTLPGINDVITLIREKGIIVIEDTTQSMYSDIDRLDADYFVGSIRKWCGVPDGGFAVCKNGILNSKPYESDTTLESQKLEASILKYKYIEEGIGEKAKFLKMYRDAETTLGTQESFFKISPVSYIIQSNLDVNTIVQKRRENYIRLSKNLNGLVGIDPIFKSLKDGQTPLFLPILCKDRDSIQQILAQNNIYAPVVWPKDEKCPDICNDADYIYNHILCLPIDQRYDCDDMDRIADILKDNCIWAGWMNWKQIEPYIEEITDWEQEVIIKYHYPDRDIPRSFSKERVLKLEQYLETEETFFWGAKYQDKLLGYYWGYISEFLFEKTWNARSSFLTEEARGKGLGYLAKVMALEKAYETGCKKAKSMYAPFNKTQQHIYNKLGYDISRIEVTKKL